MAGYEQASAIIFIGFVFLFIYLFERFDEKLWYLKLLCLGFAFLIAQNTAEFLRQLLVFNSVDANLINGAERNYLILMWSIRILFVVLFITTLLRIVDFYKHLFNQQKLIKKGDLE